MDNKAQIDTRVEEMKQAIGRNLDTLLLGMLVAEYGIPLKENRMLNRKEMEAI